MVYVSIVNISKYVWNKRELISNNLNYSNVPKKLWEESPESAISGVLLGNDDVFWRELENSPKSINFINKKFNEYEKEEKEKDQELNKLKKNISVLLHSINKIRRTVL